MEEKVASIYLSSTERNIIETTNIICQHLYHYWSDFQGMAEIVKDFATKSWPEKGETDHLDYLAVTIKGDDKGLRNVAREAGINYEELVGIYAKAVYKSDLITKKIKGIKFKCIK